MIVTINFRNALLCYIVLKVLKQFPPDSTTIVHHTCFISNCYVYFKFVITNMRRKIYINNRIANSDAEKLRATRINFEMNILLHSNNCCRSFLCLVSDFVLVKGLVCLKICHVITSHFLTYLNWKWKLLNNFHPHFDAITFLELRNKNLYANIWATLLTN